jgi:FemAB-related protein (PEP-CTERM system-associated)
MPSVSITVNKFNENAALWDSYVSNHPHASVYHLWFFKTVVEKTYRHRSHYLVAKNDSGIIKGVVPLFYIPSLFLGKSLVSIPFCDYGGVLADSPEVEKALIDAVLKLTKKYKTGYFELRQTSPLHDIDIAFPQLKSNIEVMTSKVRMKVALPADSDTLFDSFPAKLKSQIRKPQKEGCTVQTGGLELLDDFYDVFVYNMRDLGSPVHSINMIRNTISLHPEKNRLFVVYHDNIPVACSCVAGFRETLVNPWASFKRTYQKIAPNMLLYWEMLQYAVKEGYTYFDFGRSTPNEGTYKFKAQWGAVPEQLYWYKIGRFKNSSGPSEEGKKERFIQVWSKLPLSVTMIVGPLLRRQLHM